MFCFQNIGDLPYPDAQFVISCRRQFIFSFKIG